MPFPHAAAQSRKVRLVLDQQRRPICRNRRITSTRDVPNPQRSAILSYKCKVPFDRDNCFASNEEHCCCSSARSSSKSWRPIVKQSNLEVQSPGLSMTYLGYRVYTIGCYVQPRYLMLCNAVPCCPSLIQPCLRICNEVEVSPYAALKEQCHNYCQLPRPEPYFISNLTSPSPSPSPPQNPQPSATPASSPCATAHKATPHPSPPPTRTLPQDSGPISAAATPAVNPSTRIARSRIMAARA